MARTRSQKLELLASIPLFARMSQRQLQRVARHVDEVQVPTGRVLARQDEVGRELLVVVEGKAEVRRGDTLLAVLGAGDVIGEMAVLDGKRRSATVVATEACTLLTISGREFAPLLDIPGLRDNLLRALVERIRVLDDAIVD